MIQHEFEYGEAGYHGHLQIKDSGSLTTATWPVIGATICHQSGKHWPSITDIEKNTPTFKDHGLYGFSLGTYSEFFVYEDYADNIDFVSFKLGSVSVNIGQITPLAQYIYDNVHSNDYHPELDSIYSIRIFGAEAEQIESILLYIYIKLIKTYSFKFNLWTFEYTDDYEEGESEAEESVEKEKIFIASIKEIEPLRLYYKGITEKDNANAFLQFYRVLEYFSVFQYHENISELRWEKNDKATFVL